MTSGKTIALTRWTFGSKIMFVFFNVLSRLVILIFFPKSKSLLISGLQSPSAVILETPQKTNYSLLPFFSHLFAMKCWDRIHDLSFLKVEFYFSFLKVEFKPAFLFSSFTFIKRLLSSSSLSAMRVVSSEYLRLLIFFSSNLDSSLCFIQPRISHDVLCL